MVKTRICEFTSESVLRVSLGDISVEFSSDIIITGEALITVNVSDGCGYSVIQAVCDRGHLLLEAEEFFKRVRAFIRAFSQRKQFSGELRRLLEEDAVFATATEPLRGVELFAFCGARWETARWVGLSLLARHPIEDAVAVVDGVLRELDEMFSGGEGR